MKILVLGGTAFLGRHLVDAALSRGHEVTVFSRGHHGQPRRGVAWLQGDRRVGLIALAGLRWDAAVDTSAYVPSQARAAATALAGQVTHYTFVSTLSVYAQSNAGAVDETGSLEEVPEGQLEKLEAIVPDGPVTAVHYGAMYGALKVLCERAVLDVTSERAFIVRPGLIVGPYDYTDRFGYWPSRVAHGGEVLAPGDPEVQRKFIDARDLSAWMVASIEQGRAGIYNATGPDYQLTIRRFLDACRAVTSSDARVTWMDDDFLLAHRAEPWTGIPLWVPRSLDPPALRCTFQRALAAGLTYRPLAETIRDTLAWEQSRPPDRVRNAGLSATDERALLTAWHAVHA
jgi:2'-hydroxyisoflavone reductase